MPDPSAAQRRLAAKRSNERIKLVANAFHTLSLGVVGAALIIPGVASPAKLLEPAPFVWLFVAFSLHSVAQAVLQLLRSKD
jgi:hypothetical protein